MAFHFRKLLNFYFTSTTNDTTTTTTIPCTDLCDPSCADFNECYTFPAEPDPLPLPPLLPPLPPTTIVATPSSTTNGAFHLSPLVIVIVIVLVSAFVVVSYYAIVIKYCTFWTRLFTRRDLARMPQLNQLHDDDPRDDHDDVATNQFSPVVDHPIWLISTIGLHQSVINSITVIPYKKDDGLIDGTDCSVCLSEFQQGETLRLLPKCKHAFHIDCIDTWLRSHTNCPMCRAGIVANSGRPSMASNEPSFGHSRRTEFTLMADSDSSDVELGNNNNQIVVNNVSLVVDNRGAETGDFDSDNDHNKVDNFVTPIALLVRRSYSMDCRNMGAQLFQPNNTNSDSNSNPNPNSYAVMGSSSSRPLPSRTTHMKRSYSWSERVFWSALNQNDRNSALSP